MTTAIKRLLTAMQAAVFMIVLIPSGAQQLTATEIIRKADEKFNGELSGYGQP